MTLQAAPIDAGRNDRLHGDEDGVDLEPFMEQALEEVIETIMLFGVYPQPARNIYKYGGAPSSTVQFDLYEFMLERWDPADALELAVAAITLNHYDFHWPKVRAEKRLEEELKAHLATHVIVRRKALQLADAAIYE